MVVIISRQSSYCPNFATTPPEVITTPKRVKDELNTLAVQVNACIDEHLIKIGEIAQRPRNVGKNIDLIICSFRR